MKTNGKHEVVARIARRGLVFTALLAMVPSTASISRAQSGATSPAAPFAKPSAAPAEAPALPAAKGRGGSRRSESGSSGRGPNDRGDGGDQLPVALCLCCLGTMSGDSVRAQEDGRK